MGSIIFLIIVLAICWVTQPVITGCVLVTTVVCIVVGVVATRKSDKKIVSAKVVERTQFTKEECAPSGFSLGSGGGRLYWRFRQVPSHVEVKVDVVFEDGKHQRLTLTEGSGRYNRIMAICEKRNEVPAKTLQRVQPSHKTLSPSQPSPEKSTSKVDYIDIKTNQLVAGVYVIGELIPEGNYDFRWIWGEGRVEKYIDSTCTYDGRTTVTAYVGNTRDYEQQVLVNVVCKAGEYLIIKGNVIVEIRKSKPVVLNL